MARPTYSIRGTRINFNDLRAQARRAGVVDVPARKKPSDSDDVEDSVETQELQGGFTPTEPKPEVVAPAAPAAAPAVPAIAVPKPVHAAVHPAVAAPAAPKPDAPKE